MKLQPGAVNRRKRSTFGFTLMELLFGAMAFALIMVVLHSLLFGALDLRDRMRGQLREQNPEQEALRLLDRDLRGLMVTHGDLAPNFQHEVAGAMGGRSERLSFYTTSGELNETSRWPDVRLVQYFLATPSQMGSSATNRQGSTLVRAEARNILAPSQPRATVRPILDRVRSLEFSFLDQGTWAESWDAATLPTNMPAAVRVRISRMASSTTAPPRAPLEVVAPITIRPGPEPDTGGDEEPSNDDDEDENDDERGE